MKNNIKIVLSAALWGFIVILFTIASGVVCSVVTSIDTQEKIWIVQGIFSWLSIFPAIIYIRHNHGLKFSLIKDMNEKGIRCCFYFIPFIIILAPMLICGFAKENAYYFISSAFFTLGVGVSEELYFRGIVVTILGKKFKESGIIILSTLLFGLGHSAAALSGMSGLLVILTIINALLFGWMSAEVLYCSHGLLPLMIFHFLHNYLSKAAPIPVHTEIIVDFIRGALMLIFAIYFSVIRIKANKQSANIQE